MLAYGVLETWATQAACMHGDHFRMTTGLERGGLWLLKKRDSHVLSFYSIWVTNSMSSPIPVEQDQR